MPNYSKLIQELLGETRVGIENTSNHPEIKSLMAETGFDDASLQYAANLNTQLEDKYKVCQFKHGEQIEASEKLYAKFGEEIKLYMDLRKLARRALKDVESQKFLEKLGLNDDLKRSFEGFLDQASRFYKHAMADQQIMDRLAKFGITSEKLQERLDALDELKQLNTEQEAKKGEAQLSRQERDAIYKELNTWWLDFKAAAKIKFGKNNQYLEIIGITAPTEGTKRKKETPEEETQSQDTQTDPTDPTNPTDQGQ